MATAGLSFANPFMDKVGVGEAPNPYTPFSPTSGIGLGGLGPSAADMAVAGDALVKQSQFTMPAMTRPAAVAFSPSRNEFFVQGTTFSADDAPAALQAEQLLGRPGVELPAGGDWVPLDATAYQQYLGSIRNPSLGRLAAKNFGRGVDSTQALIGRGLQLAGAEGLGGRIVEQQTEDLRRTSPYERQFTDIDSGRGAVEWLVANFAQQGPNLIESVLTAGAGFLAGTAAGGPLAGAGGAMAGLLGKGAFKEAVIAAARKQAAGEVLNAAENKLLREAAGIAGAVTASYAQNLATGASDIYGELRDQGADAADVDARLKALAGSVPYAMLETLPEYLLASRLFGGLGARPALAGSTTTKAVPGGTQTVAQGPSMLGRAGELLRRGAVGGVVGGTLEGTTEAGQESLLLGISGQDMSSPESVNRLINSFAAGFGIGGPLGAVANLRSKNPENLLNPAQNPEPQPGTALVAVPPTQPPGPGTGVVPYGSDWSATEMPSGPRAQLPGPGTGVAPYGAPGTLERIPTPPPPPAGLTGPVTPITPAGPPSIMVTPDGVAYPDQMLRQQANVPPGAASGNQGVLDVLGGSISAQELAARMQPSGAAPAAEPAAAAPVVNPAQGALQFSGPSPTPPVNRQLPNQLQARQDRLRREREFAAAEAQQAAQVVQQTEALARQTQYTRDLERMQQGEAPAPTPTPMPMRQAGPTQPVQLELFNRKQAPRPSRAEGLRRGVGTQVPEPTGTTPLTAADRRKQGNLFTQEGKPTLAALKSAGKRRTLPRIAAKPRATSTPGARGFRKGARVSEVNVTERADATQEGKLKRGGQPKRQQDNAGVQGGGDAGDKPASKVQAGGAQTGGGGKSLKRGEKPTKVTPTPPQEDPAVAARRQETLRRAELAQAGRQWPEYADPKTQPKWADLTPEQQEQWRKVVVDDERPSIGAAEEIAPPTKEEPPVPKPEAAPAAATSVVPDGPVAIVVEYADGKMFRSKDGAKARDTLDGKIAKFEQLLECLRKAK